MAKYPDISHWKTVSDWGKVKKECPFIISKATQGTGYVDPTLDGFIKSCEQHKIPYWLYAYLNRGNERAQAEFLVKTCRAKAGTHFVGYILDVEEGNPAAGVKSALDYLEGLDAKSMIYTMYAQHNMYKSVIDGRGTRTAWWEARYGNNTGSYSSKYPCHGGADLHQYTDHGTCGGISGTCDLSRLTGTESEEWFTVPAAVKISGKKPSGKCPYKEPETTLKKGSSGEGVLWMQWHLNKSADKQVISLVQNLSLDGKWGSRTDEAFAEFQKKFPETGTDGKPDGRCGLASRKKLKALL